MPGKMFRPIDFALDVGPAHGPKLLFSANPPLPHLTQKTTPADISNWLSSKRKTESDDSEDIVVAEFETTELGGDIGYARTTTGRGGKNKDGTDTDTGGGGGANGKGKNKDTTVDPDPTPEPEPTPEPTPEPGPAPEPEPTDYAASDYTSGLDTPGGFNIDVVFAGTWTAAQKDALYGALEMISDVVTGDVADTNSAVGMIDDLRISATMTTIDGAGGTGGWGGYSQVRSDSKLPYQGYIRMDEADADMQLNGGIFDDFVFHEVLHAMGFGTGWAGMGLVETINGQLRFTGANAIEAYNNEYAHLAANDADSLLGVPVEMEGGNGTAGVHWDDGVFGNELMTGYLNWNNTISDMTLAALEDMGYETIYGDDVGLV